MAADGGILGGMKVKTSVTLSVELLHAIDAQEGQRSAFIEAAAWAYLRVRQRECRDARDLAIINANAERLNAEALDALDYQTPCCPHTHSPVISRSEAERSAGGAGYALPGTYPSLNCCRSSVMAHQFGFDAT
jgi:hypothetical protein